MCISGCSPFQFSMCVLLCFYVKVTFMNKYFTSVSIYLSINSLYQKRLAYTKPDCVLILRLYHEQSLHLVKKNISNTLAWAVSFSVTLEGFAPCRKGIALATEES